MERPKLLYYNLKGVARKLMALEPDNRKKRRGCALLLTGVCVPMGIGLVGTSHLNFMVGVPLHGRYGK